MQDNASVPGGGSASGSKSRPLRDALGDLLTHSRGQLSELLKLITLEVRYSGLMLGVVVAMAVLSVVALFSMWGLLLAAAVSWLLATGWSVVASLVIVALANGLLLCLSLWQIYRALVRIGFTYTRQVLGLENTDATK